MCQLKYVLNEYGVDVLIVPYYGHRSSFSKEYLFDNMKGGKTRSIIIVPEKIIKQNKKNNVDLRHYFKAITDRSKQFQRAGGSAALVDYCE